MFAKKRKFFDYPTVQSPTRKVPLCLFEFHFSECFRLFVNTTSRVSVAMETICLAIGEIPLDTLRWLYTVRWLCLSKSREKNPVFGFLRTRRTSRRHKRIYSSIHLSPEMFDLHNQSRFFFPLWPQRNRWFC